MRVDVVATGRRQCGVWYTGPRYQMRGCLDDDEILAMVAGTLAAETHAQCLAHIGSCSHCRLLVAETSKGSGSETARSTGGAFDRARALAAGVRVGRYEIKRLIGLGGAGLVYEAFDPQLSRRLALKLVRPDARAEEDATAGAARLLREARAMAQLSHPNVVTAFDAGEFDGGVFIAMELVEGRTLAGWLKEESPPPAAIGAMFLAAAKGLVAAHAAGLIHRDFKPENVLLGSDGRPRVTDFGLARAAEIPAEDRAVMAAAGAQEPGPVGSMLLTMTRAGVLAGTPAYMAPEQFQGARTDAATDQFNFCASLYVALYRRAPFGAAEKESTTLASLARAVVLGELRPPPVGSGVPRAVHAALRRGLASAPSARFPSMAALLEELATAFLPSRRYNRWWVAAVPAAALALATGWLLVKRASRDGDVAQTSAPAVEPHPAPAPAPISPATVVATTPPDPATAPRIAPRTRPAARNQKRAIKPTPPLPPPAKLGDGLKDPYGPR